MNIVPVRSLDHVDQFLSNFTSENTRNSYKQDLKEYSLFCQVSDPFNLSTLISYREHIAATSASSTVVRKLSSVKSFMSFLAGQGLLRNNPASDLRMPSASVETQTEAFSDVEASLILQAPDVSTFNGSVHRIMLVLLLNLGLRRAELVSLRVSNVSSHRGVRYLTVMGKGKKQRMVPITDALAAELDAYVEKLRLLPEDFLIQSYSSSTKDRPVDPSTVYRVVKRYAREVGVTKRVSPHSCRATVISHLLEKNVSPRHVADLVGHTSITTTVDTYDKKRDRLSNPASSKVSYGP